MRIFSAFQNFDKNNLSRSDTISNGRPFSQYQWSKNTTANSSAVIFAFVGTILMSDPNRQVIEQIMSYPLSRGSGPTKSIATLSTSFWDRQRVQRSRWLCCSGLISLTIDTCGYVPFFQVSTHVWPVIDLP